MSDYNSSKSVIVKLLTRELYLVYMQDPRNYCDELHAKACGESAGYIVGWVISDTLHNTALSRVFNSSSSEHLLSRVIYHMLHKRKPIYLSILDRISTQAAKWLIQNQLRIILSLNPGVIKGGSL